MSTQKNNIQQKPQYQLKSKKLNLTQYSADGYCFAVKSIHIPDPNCNCESSTSRHSHSFFELAIIVHGEGEHWHNGRRSNVVPGQVYLISPGEYHYFKGFRHLTLQNFMFSREMFRSMRLFIMQLPNYEYFFMDKERQPKLIINSVLISEFETLLQNIALECQKKSYQNKLLLFSYIAQLLGKLLVYDNNYAGNPRGETDKLQNVLAYMKQNFNKQITMGKLAQLAHVSQSTLYRLFYQEFSMPPKRWLLNLRITKARELLMHSGKNINDVSYACGFNDPLYFSRQFQKCVGCSPRQYRTHGQGRIEIIREYQYQCDLSFLPIPTEKKEST